MKIIDKINARIERDEKFYSFEYFPPKTLPGVENLYTRMDRMALLEPLFADVTWGAGGSTSKLTLEISGNAQKYCGLEILMHLTCTNMPVNDIQKALETARDNGIQNILALRGDAPRGANSFQECDKGFSHAVDLVKYIKREFGDTFGIGVAGHPEVHAEAKDRESDLLYLKDKVDAGADFIISQLFYDVDAFDKFVHDCRQIGIKCPIIPAIMPIQNFNGFIRMTAFCNAKVPSKIREELEPIKDNDEAVKEYGVKLGIDMCKHLLANGAPGVHFYTLNLERSVRRILSGLNLISDGTNSRELPWRPSALASRSSEKIRPIFWANRPKSYLHRTSSWDEFPNGRWGDNRSPAFGDLKDSHYNVLNPISQQERKALWGECPIDVQDIYHTFAKYIKGEIIRLPWCEEPLHLETQTIQNLLVEINKAGYLTINSQPSVNGAPSDHALFGWGGPGGRVYQKAYVECFVSPEGLKSIMNECSSRKTIQYMAVDARGNTYSNYEKGTTAVTWGVFPNKEILQPTIVDTDSFMVWKDEAFSLWLSMWASLYEDDSRSCELIHSIHDTFFLVSIVDGDFMQGNIWDVFPISSTNPKNEK